MDNLMSLDIILMELPRTNTANDCAEGIDMRHTSRTDWPSTYEFRIYGYLSSQRLPWLADMTVTELDNGETCFVGQLEDLAALYGLLSRMRDLGLLLLSVNRLQNSKEE
jgi:hypothetical protein